MVQLAFYTFAIPLFYISGFIDNLIKLRNPFAHFKLATKYTVNVARIWRFTPTILANKPYFYKVL